MYDPLYISFQTFEKINFILASFLTPLIYLLAEQKSSFTKKSARYET